MASPTALRSASRPIAGRVSARVSSTCSTSEPSNMAVAPARYYDGVTAQAMEVGTKPGIGELLIFHPADFSIVARWPLQAIAVLGDSEHEAVPLLLLKGS